MKKIDLTTKFLEAKQHSAHWTEAKFRAFLQQFTDAGFVINWDDTVIEKWARIFFEQKSQAVVSLRFPVILIHAEYDTKISPYLTDANLTVVWSEDFVGEYYRIDRYNELFPDCDSDAFDPKSFSLDQLIYATMT
ncbi:MAG: hypothetical protein RLP44_02080 [Aggregatilineales bacterium]